MFAEYLILRLSAIPDIRPEVPLTKAVPTESVRMAMR
jgi:hypothetical protein